MPSYILGRDQVTTAPGVVNDDIQNVELKVSGSEQDVTVFKSTALTQIETMVALLDVSFEITAMHATAEVGDSGTFVVGNLDGEDLSLDAVVTDVKRSVTPKGVEQYVVSYGVKPAAD
jgi:hypothetical protein